jgi:Fur family ferric uptake transcriptional regulator
MQNEMDTFEQCLRTRGLKHSKPRQDIVEVFLASEGHLSAHDLYEQVKRKNPRVGFATVYRTLKLLAECGLARTMDYGDGTVRYEPDRFQHHHVICTSCNRTVEFLSPELDALLRHVQHDNHFMPKTPAVRILSVCADCQQATPSQSWHGRDFDTIVSRDALQVAIANEQRGLRFYSQGLAVAEDETTRAVFGRLLGEEEGHLETLQQEYESLRQAHAWLDDAPPLLHFDRERLEGIFPNSPQHIVQIVQSASPAAVLFMAMSAEWRSYEFFRDYADKVSYPKGRVIFRQFADEERQHISLIRHAFDALQDRTYGTPAAGEPA